MKTQGMSLQEIKHTLQIENQNEEIDLQKICLHMQTLQSEVSTLVEKMNQQEQLTKQTIKNKISNESVALMQSLLKLIT